MKNLGLHLNEPHLTKWGPLVYIGARLYLLFVQWILHFPESIVWPITAFVIVVFGFWINDKPFLGRENADNGPDNIYPGYAIFEVLNTLPIPLALLVLEVWTI